MCSSDLTPPVEQQLPFNEEKQPVEQEEQEEVVKPKEEPKKESNTGKENPKKPSPWSRFVTNVKKTVTQGTLEFIDQITNDENEENNDKN